MEKKVKAAKALLVLAVLITPVSMLFTLEEFKVLTSQSMHVS